VSTGAASEASSRVPSLGPGARLLLLLIRVYRLGLSPALSLLPLLGCRFQPTCSTYAEEAIRRHGGRRGAGLALSRLLRCRPFGPHGFDPVP
jgi:putative membrane protein insertion efficiency factor